MKTLRLFALSVVAAGLVAGSTFADEGKPATGGNAKPAPVAKAPENESPKMDAMMKELNVSYEKKLDEKANVVYFAVKEYGPDNFCFDVEVSKSQNYTWVLFPCGKALDSGIPAEIMEKMLVEQTKMGTAFFQYNPTTKMIFLKMPLATSTLDAKRLKQEINWMLKDATRTRPLWDSTTWATSATAGK